MRILIVDDDKLIRFSLKSMLLDILPFGCFITEATDGIEMIHRCNEYEPDIAFVDIRMPNLDGLSAIKKCQALSPDTSFIVITGYSDFEYAKKCIQLGVTDYILKPISPDALTEIISKCQEKISCQQQQQNNNFKLTIHDLLHGLNTENVPALPHSDTKMQLLTYGIFIDCSINHHLYSEIHNHLISDIKAYNNQFLSSEFLYSIDYAVDGYLCVTYFVPKDSVPSVTRKLEFICNTYHSTEIRIYLLACVHTDLLSFRQGIRQIDKQSNIRINYAPYHIIDLQNIQLPEKTLAFFNEIILLANSFQYADEIRYTHILNTICRTYTDFPPDCNVKNIADYLTCTIQLSIATGSFKDFMKSFVTSSDSMYQNIDSKNNSKIDLIIDYVNRAYTTDISINNLADKFDLTPNYISKLFHEKTGLKFIDYISDLRMKAAKKILIEKSDLPLKDVAISVGYYSPRHFSNIFKKYTQLSPSEYRRKHVSGQA